MSSTPPCITLTSDFGWQDAYVAEMKGVLLQEGPAQLQLLDLSHGLPRQDVDAAARFLGAAVPRFPRGTVHLAVVDPGVGSNRQALAMWCHEQYVVAPDNGLITDLWHPGCHCVAIDPQRLGDKRPAPSSTFHGRDLFAPVAARLARGSSLEHLGTPLATPLRLERPEPVLAADGLLHGIIVAVDHFGNAASNIRGAQLLALGHPQTALQVTCAGFVGAIVDHYAQVPVGQALALIDSRQRLEIAIREGDAAQRLQLAPGTPIIVQPHQAL